MSFEPWASRQKDYANSFNPGYLAVLVSAIVKGFVQTGHGMPLSLLFPAVPMVLHPTVRRALPKTIASHLSKWLRDHPDVKSELLTSTQLLVPEVKEGVLAALRLEWIRTDEHLLTLGSAPAGRALGAEFDEDLRKSVQIGRWFAASGTEREIFQQIGVRP